MDIRATEYISGITSAARGLPQHIGVYPHYTDVSFRGKLRKLEIMVRNSDNVDVGRINPDWRRIVVHGFLLPLRDGFETLRQDSIGETRIGVYKLYIASLKPLFLVGDHIKVMGEHWRIRNMQNFGMANYVSYTIERAQDTSYYGGQETSFNEQRDVQ